MNQIVTLLTDFGVQDSYIAEMKAVLLKGLDQPMIVDLCHEVPSFEINLGAFQLMRAYHHFPLGSWHLAVVDPGVGSDRKSVYVEVGSHHFVGPDNGLLKWAVCDAQRRFKTEAQIFEIDVPKTNSPTFHGRDLFAPAIVNGIAGKMKTRKISSLSGKEFPFSRELDDVQRGEIIGSDKFGNIITSIPFTPEKAEAQIEEKEERYPSAPNYLAIEDGKIGLIRGSHGFWELAANRASAWDTLKVKVENEITIYPGT